MAAEHQAEKIEKATAADEMALEGLLEPWEAEENEIGVGAGISGLYQSNHSQNGYASNLCLYHNVLDSNSLAHGPYLSLSYGSHKMEKIDARSEAYLKWSHALTSHLR